jgi:hypothetical protein
MTLIYHPQGLHGTFPLTHVMVSDTTWRCSPRRTFIQLIDPMSTFGQQVISKRYESFLRDCSRKVLVCVCKLEGGCLLNVQSSVFSESDIGPVLCTISLMRNTLFDPVKVNQRAEAETENPHIFHEILKHMTSPVLVCGFFCDICSVMFFPRGSCLTLLREFGSRSPFEWL